MARVLVVDDDADSCEAMAGVLRLRGHDAVCAANGREALSVVIDNPPDFAVVDVLMPEMNGVEFVRVVRSYLRLQHLPVLIVTAFAEAPELRGDLAKLDVVGVLPKVNLDLASVADVVDRHTRT
jgi:CheY-like chemotaxis protein